MGVVSWLLLMCCLRMGRLLTRVLLVARLMFAVMTFVISILTTAREILRLKDAGYLTQTVAACDRLWGRILIPRLLPAFVPSGIACLRRRFIFRCRAIELLR